MLLSSVAWVVKSLFFCEMIRYSFGVMSVHLWARIFELRFNRLWLCVPMPSRKNFQLNWIFFWDQSEFFHFASLNLCCQFLSLLFNINFESMSKNIPENITQMLLARERKGRKVEIKKLRRRKMWIKRGKGSVSLNFPIAKPIRKRFVGLWNLIKSHEKESSR